MAVFHGGDHDDRSPPPPLRIFLRKAAAKKKPKWFGAEQQYARAIGLYYTKFGKYPTKVEDLTKQTNGVRFLRQAYTDPMNNDDGSWRFIYVGPNGQLIGSLRQTSLPQTVLILAGNSGGFGDERRDADPFNARRDNKPATLHGRVRDSKPILPRPRTRWSPSPSPYGNRYGRIHHRCGEQNQEAFAADLFGRRYLPAWEFIWNPTGQNAHSWATAGKSESKYSAPGTTHPPTDPNGPAGNSRRISRQSASGPPSMQ